MTEAQQSFPWQTVGGYAFYEVLSALQKSIRRGLEEDALFWATELYLSGYEIQAWRRLCIIASEDIGLANPPAFTEVRNLYLEWKEVKTTSEAKLHFIFAVLLLVRSPKSRIVDHALITFFEGPREAKPMPDWALDKHTASGRALGRGQEHFFTVGAVLDNITLADAYVKRAAEIRITRESKKPLDI